MVRGTVQLGAKAYSGPGHSWRRLALLVATVLETVQMKKRTSRFHSQTTFHVFFTLYDDNVNSLWLVLLPSFLE